MKLLSGECHKTPKDDKSILTTSHYLSHCWPRSVSPCGFIRPMSSLIGPQEMLKYFLAATKQLYEWFSPSVRLSVRLSVTPFENFPVIVSSWNFHQWLPLTRVMSMQKVKVRGGRSRSQRSKPSWAFQTITPVWIHIWWWNDAQSLMWHRRGALLFFNVIRPISRSHGTKELSILTQIGHFWTVTAVWIHAHMAAKWCTKLEVA